MDENGFTRRELLQGGIILLISPLFSKIAFAESGRTPTLPGQPPAPASRFTWPVHELLQPNMENALFVRNLDKPVEEALMIDDMESDLGWEASSVVQMGYTKERAKKGSRSLRFSTEQRNEEYIQSSRNPNGSFSGSAQLFDFLPFAATARLKLSPAQNWTNFNRLSLWCYLHPTGGNPVNSICLQFVCEGAAAGPYDPIAVNYFADLKESEWNLLAWEIPEFQRDRVNELIVFLPAAGVPFRNAPSRLTCDFDQLRVERVAAEQVEGWHIAKDKMAYNHLGYPSHGQKLAIISDPEASAFELIQAETGDMVGRMPVEKVKTLRGYYGICDFTSFSHPGAYRIQAGSSGSEPFNISDDAWRPLVEATLNAFYGLRCGFAVPGVHDACHCDVTVSHNRDSRIVGGGWHDAANLAQDPENTFSSVYAILELADALAQSDASLAERALEEARWGLEWVLRMRFAPGVRLLKGSYSYHTDGIPGTLDDVVYSNEDADRSGPGFTGISTRSPTVGSETFKNLLAALAEARGAQFFKDTDEKFASELLQAAEEDFTTVLGDRPAPPVEGETPNWRTAPWQNEVGYMALTAVELYHATGKKSYAETAVKTACWALDMQELRFIEGSPVTGYFYEDAARTRIMHEFQRLSGAQNSFEEGALLAFRALCDTFPEHPDWIRWYEGLLAFSEFFCRKGAEASAPFDMVPAAVWRESDLDAPMPADRTGVTLAKNPGGLFPTPPTPELTRRQLGELYQAGTYLSPGQRLRVFPLPIDHIRHGGTSVHLSKTISLAAAAQTRRSANLVELAWRQLEWVAGSNPFSRSLIYGVGYDWWQNFTVSLPNFVGGVSVGMNTYRDDSPAWGNNAVFPYKEIWVMSSCRLAHALAHLAGKARAEGSAPQGATLKHAVSGKVTTIEPGTFKLVLAPGTYTASYGGFERQVTLAPGCLRNLDLDSAETIDLKLETKGDKPGALTLRIGVRGSGRHEIDFRTRNADLPNTRLTFELGSGGTETVELVMNVPENERAWIVVAVPNGNLTEAVELFGTILSLNRLGEK